MSIWFSDPVAWAARSSPLKLLLGSLALVRGMHIARKIFRHLWFVLVAQTKVLTTDKGCVHIFDRALRRPSSFSLLGSF